MFSQRVRDKLVALQGMDYASLDAMIGRL